MTVTLGGNNLQKEYLSSWVDLFSTSTVAGYVPE
jgi:hypothetical protein